MLPRGCLWFEMGTPSGRCLCACAREPGWRALGRGGGGHGGEGDGIWTKPFVHRPRLSPISDM